MHNFAEKYYNNLSNLFNSIRATNNQGSELNFFNAIEKVCDLIILETIAGHKLMFIGNGASAATSSHMSTDFWKNGGMRGLSPLTIAHF